MKGYPDKIIDENKSLKKKIQKVKILPLKKRKKSLPV